MRGATKNHPAGQLGDSKLNKNRHDNSSSSQQARFLKYLEIYLNLSTVQARDEYGILSLSAQIQDLRQKGQAKENTMPNNSKLADEILTVRALISCSDHDFDWLFYHPQHWLSKYYLKKYRVREKKIDASLEYVEKQLRENKM